MPTIDQLDPALAATDLDEIAVSQAGILRRVTRAQLLAGVQQQITLPTASLLGRQSLGVGAPESIALGPGLSIVNGQLATTFPPVAIGGLDASASVVTPDGATTPRKLSSLFASSVTLEDFGAAGDGVTDDTEALVAAISSQRPVHLGPRRYAISGQCTIPVAATLKGTPGLSVLSRGAQASGGAWISISGPSFTAEGVTFDANSPAISGESWAVLVTAACRQTRFFSCTFQNAGGPTLGNGLTILASDPAQSSHTVDSCEASGNAAHGIWLQAVDGARLANNRAHDNAGYGLCADYNDASFRTSIRLATITGNACWNNLRGIAVGNFNATNQQPPTWGNAHPDAIGVIISGNICHDNRVYGIAAAGRSLIVDANLLSNNGNAANGGAGILANCAYSRVAGNTVVGAAQFGIDCGGSIVLDVAGNHVSGAVVGINPGGSQGVRVSSNYLQDNGWAVLVYNVETDGAGGNFGLATSNLCITDNTVALSSGAAGGVWLIDAPQSVLVARNSFYGSNQATISQCLFTHTDSAIVEGNRWNNTPRAVVNPSLLNGLQTLAVPDIADEVILTSSPAGVQSIQTQRQIAVSGQVGFIKVTAGGSNYTRATVSVGGSGSGAAATAYLSNGAVIGIALTDPGSGYGRSGSTAVVTITGDGTDAAAWASVGLPVLDGRRLKIACGSAATFARAGSAPFQDNWTLATMTIPANATVTFTGTSGGWRADSNPLADYLAPAGDGSLVVRTLPNADLTLRPSSAGRLRIATDTDPAGYVAATGHGVPEGSIVAPPGSDYRNLDGGSGQTFWIKRTGTDSHGWFAIA